MFSHYKIVKVIAPCLLAIVIDALGFGLVYPILTAMFTSNQISIVPASYSTTYLEFLMGIGFMLYPLCMFFGTSFMGDLSDKWGRKKVLVLCMFGICFSFFLMGLGTLIGSLFFLFLGRGLSGLMAGSQPIAQAAIGDLSNDKDKANHMSIVALSYSVGAVFGPVLGGFLSDKQFSSVFGFFLPFFTASLISLVAAVWLMKSFTETFQKSDERRVSFLRPIFLLIEAFYEKNIFLLSLVFFLMQLGFSLFFQYIVVKMRLQFEYSSLGLGAINAMIGIGFGFGLIFGMPTLSKKLSTKALAILSILITGIGLLLAGWFDIGWIEWVLAIVIAFADIIGFACMLTLFSNYAGQNRQGWGMGIANAAMALSWTITGLISFTISFVGTNTLIILGGLLMIGSSILLTKLKHQSTKA